MYISELFKNVGIESKTDPKAERRSASSHFNILINHQDKIKVINILINHQDKTKKVI